MPENRWSWYAATTVLSMVFFFAPHFPGLLAQDDTEKQDQAIELSSLDTFLKNRDGKLIQYFKITFEEFERVYKSLQSEQAPTFDYTIRSANIVAKVRGQSAQLDIELTIEPKSDGEFPVPIAFENSFFPNSAVNRSLFRRDQKFYLRLKGKQGKTSTIRLSAVKNITRARGRKHLEFDLPAATFTTLTIHDTEPNQVFSASMDSINRPLPSLFSNGTSIEFSGLKEDSTISWARKDATQENRRGIVDDNATVEAVVYRDRVEYAARFTLTAEDPIQRFDIGLPTSTTQATLSNGEGTITPVRQTDSWKIFSVQQDQPNQAFTDLDVRWVVPSSPGATNLVGFEIPGFAPPTGLLTVRSSQEVNFVVANPLFNLSNETRSKTPDLATFNFQTSVFSAPLFLILDTQAELQIVDYLLRLSPDRAALEMNLPGAAFNQDAESVKLELNGWSVKPDQPYVVVDSLLREVTLEPPFFLNDKPRLKIDFVLKEPSAGDRRFRLPRIRDRKMDRFDVTVQCNTDVEALFDRSRNQSFEVDSEFEVRKVNSLNELNLETSSEDVLELKLNVAAVQPFTDSKMTVDLLETEGSFNIDFQCSIQSSRSTDACAIVLADGDYRSVTVNKQIVDLSEWIAGQPLLVRFDEPEKEIQVRIRSENRQLAVSDQAQLVLPEFLLPLLGPNAENEVVGTEIQGRNFGLVETETNLNIRTPSGTLLVPDAAWSPTGDVLPGTPRGYRSSGGNVIQLTKTIRADDDIQVRKTWCQTTLNSEFRQDRIVIRFVPNRSRVTWKMPDGTRLVSGTLNGQPFSGVYDREKNELQTGFSTFEGEQIVEFNLRYFSSMQNPQLQLRLPSTNRLTWSQNLYWTIQLPDNQYVLNYSDSLSASYVLAWTGFFLKPTPRLNPQQLERWIDTKRGSEIEYLGNDYLFASFGILDESSVYIISKRNLVLVFGLFFISLGIAFVSLSFMRNTLLLVTIAGGILIFGMWYPIWFVQLLQIEIFVGFLFCLGFIITRITAWLNPTRDETRIETNVPSILLAAPDSGVNQATPTRSDSRPGRGD
ncbi:MAG: hypothetical protein VX768_10040 [Planctomycetota bacterium]|nr:hypothetical protein [Planctomycetota bacterium]